MVSTIKIILGSWFSALAVSPASSFPIPSSSLSALTLLLSPRLASRKGPERRDWARPEQDKSKTKARNEKDKEGSFEAGLEPRDQDDEHQVHRDQSMRVYGPRGWSMVDPVLIQPARLFPLWSFSLSLSVGFFICWISPSFSRFISLSSSSTRVGSQLPRDENPRCPPADTNGCLFHDATCYYTFPYTNNVLIGPTPLSPYLSNRGNRFADGLAQVEREAQQISHALRSFVRKSLILALRLPDSRNACLLDFLVSYTKGGNWFCFRK